MAEHLLEVVEVVDIFFRLNINVNIIRSEHSRAGLVKVLAKSKLITSDPCLKKFVLNTHT
jgi:hypothetical protein